MGNTQNHISEIPIPAKYKTIFKICQMPKSVVVAVMPSVLYAQYFGLVSAPFKSQKYF